MNRRTVKTASALTTTPAQPEKEQLGNLQPLAMGQSPGIADAFPTRPENEPRDLTDICAAFHRNGFAVLPSLIPSDAADNLRHLAEQRYQDPQVRAAPPERDLMRGDIALMRMFEYHQAFRDMIDLEPVASLIETILGPDCHMIAQSALRIPPGKGIVEWHIDDSLFFPFLGNIPTGTAEGSTIPCFTLNVMVALTDIEDDLYGPTQVIPRSHLSGRDSPRLPGTPTSLLARAGDAYLINSQTWHRGAPNQSDRTRYLLGTAYGRRFIAQRFYPFIDYRLPSGILEGASDRLVRFLGRHDMGPYG
jgi:ectoine hydroxylase-related dioxygenase (phytanoyl-CoA dioxygenase family)